MSKQLYEEALADVKKVKEVAENNAKRAIMEAVTPRIRDLIEKELLREFDSAYEDEDDFSEPGAPDEEGELLTDLELAPSDDELALDMQVSDTQTSSVAPGINPIVSCDGAGKVTLDLGALSADCAGAAVEPPVFGTDTVTTEDDPSEEYEMNFESMSKLSRVHNKNLNITIEKLDEMIKKYKLARAKFSESKEYNANLAKLISFVENTYDYVQESVVDSAKKNILEQKLESFYGELNKLQERKMSNKKNKSLNEEDVTLKLTGLPDDLDLESIGVDMITGEEEDGEEGQQDDMGDLEDQGGDDQQASDDQLGLDDLGGQDQNTDQLEAEEMDDDTVVEIDENFLRREIAKMRGLNEMWEEEEVAPQDDDEVLEVCMDEMDMMDQGDDMLDQPEAVEQMDMPMESVHRRSVFEKKLQEKLQLRANLVKKEYASARKNKNVNLMSELKKRFASVTTRLAESTKRYNKCVSILSEAANKTAKATSNRVSERPSEDNTVVESLRTKLAEVNLFNAKLLYTNKLLQNESLTTRQKSQIIEQLDSAKTLSEAKLVYESLSKTLTGNGTKRVTEGTARKVLGSSSRASGNPAATSKTEALVEGAEADRWARLAGITRR